MHPQSLAGLSCSVLEQLLCDWVHELAQQFHRSAKLSLQECPACKSRCRQFCSRSGFDIFANSIQTPSTVPYYNCEGCGRQIAASRYAAHLEKCKGRTHSVTSFTEYNEDDSEQETFQRHKRKKRKANTNST
ncbi:SAGA complex subunit Sgf11 [Schizosaccharomyces japonicus yFS275]|uniref:SAGA-associated factor 11 n=1 Tax=Schizosaccharomyces japonicus (strain yFS275 / FY16936) TaxID=402676 RepID=B6K4N7_SCHJY|nr:SAGA complex subunit Sgf11 [Schizosaccharomyces japonicus yFS275]EEB08444.2 SAGA complex subunit Sgf11 [Schizosaccharomyces japonicus yFS275]